MKTKKALEQKAQTITKAQSTETLVSSFELTEDQPITQDLATARGWIMDELEERDPDAFDRWIDSCQGSPREFFTV